MPIIAYPKMLTLFDRDSETFKVNEHCMKSPDFEVPKTWLVDEKIHGQNIRIYWDGHTVRFAARSSENVNDIHKELREDLSARFRQEKLEALFGEKEVTIFGEGYGAGINGGANYSPTKRFVMFDVNVQGIWLTRESVKHVAQSLDVAMVPEIFQAAPLSVVIELVRTGFNSLLADRNTGIKHEAEGIVARTELCTRFGQRLMFKLKTCDFAKTQEPAA